MSATAVLTTEKAAAGQISAPPLRVSFSWTLAGNVVYAATQFGILSVLAKLGNPAVVGQYALALAISAPVFMFTNLQLRGVQATDARNQYQFADYFTLRCLSTLLGVLVISLIVAGSHYDRTTKLVILLVTLAKAIETFSDVIAGHLQKFERLDQVARALMIRGAVSVSTFATAFWITRSLAVAVLALAATWLAVISLYDFRVLARVLNSRAYFRYSAPLLGRLAWLSLPLGIVMALNSLSANVPRYILEHKLGRAELGIFASLAYLVMAVGLISIALGQSVSARMSRLFADGNLDAFRAVLRKLLLIAVLIGVSGVTLALLFGRPVLTLIYRPEYAEHVNLLVVMVIDGAITAVSIFLGFGMTSARCFRSQIPIMLATVAASVVLTFVLLPSLGLLGAAYALLLATVVRTSASYLVLSRALHKRSLA